MNDRQPITGPLPIDTDARHAHVIGSGPRIESLQGKDVDPPALDLVNAIRVSAGAQPVTADAVPDYMRLMMKHPPIFRCQMEMGTAIFGGRIPPRERELAVLRVGWLTQSPYEWGEHVNIGKRYGLSAEEVDRVTQGSSAPGWNAHDRAILRATEELLADYAVSDESWSTLAETWDEQQLIEFPMMVGQYVATAFVQNTLRVRLAESNPGLGNR